MVRAVYLNGKTATATKPWIDLGMSRRTWYRRKKETGEVITTAVPGRYLSGRTAAAMKPWEAEGISRATWYLKKKEQKK